LKIKLTKKYIQNQEGKIWGMTAAPIKISLIALG
jgi:hypothetical protein